MINILEILGKIGFDWPVALANTINFLIVFFLLKKFVFPSVSNFITERQKQIEQGLEKAKEAEIRLREVDTIAKEKLKEADLESIHIIKQTENRAKELERSLKIIAEEKHKELMHQIQSEFMRQQEETKQDVLKEASELVKKFITKTVELKPEAIDEAIIKKAVSQIKNEN